MAEPRLRVAALVRRGGTLLLVRQRGADGEHWLLPGGGVEWGETLSAALCREVEEEVGLRVAPGGLAILCESISPAGGRHIVHCCFHARITGRLQRPRRDPVVLEAKWWLVSDLESAEIHPPIAAVLQRVCRGSASAPVELLGNTWV